MAPNSQKDSDCLREKGEDCPSPVTIRGWEQGLPRQGDAKQSHLRCAKAHHTPWRLSGFGTNRVLQCRWWEEMAPPIWRMTISSHHPCHSLYDIPCMVLPRPVHTTHVSRQNNCVRCTDFQAQSPASNPNHKAPMRCSHAVKYP